MHALRLVLLLLLLLQCPGYGTLDTHVQANQGLVAEPSPSLGDVVVAGHAAVSDALAVKGGGLADEVEVDLAEEAEHEARLARHDPGAAGALVAAGGVPDGARKVPEVDGLAVGHEEGLAVDALVVKGLRLGGGRHEEGARRQQVGVRHVLDVGEVEQVVVLADLDVVLALLVDVHHVVDGLHVAFAEDARGADRGRQEVGRDLGPVGGQGYGLGFGLDGVDGGHGQLLRARFPH